VPRNKVNKAADRIQTAVYRNIWYETRC